MDMNKYRKISSFAETGATDFYKKMIKKQAKNEFDIYQNYSPNTHKVYVNDEIIPILATFQDVSDLEVRTDTKWMATSLEHKVNAGDIITWDISGNYKFDANGKPLGKKWMVVYDKEKNTANSYKVKVQQCTYPIKVPYFKNDGTPDIFVAHSIVMTYISDTKDFKQPMPSEVGTTFMQLPYNDITSSIDREMRCVLYKEVYEVTGVDFTNVDYYINKGFLKLTLRPAMVNKDLDRVDLGVANYYMYFAKPTTVAITPTPSSITLSSTLTKLKTRSTTVINASGAVGGFNFTFEGNSMGCTLTDVTPTSCMLNVGSQVGIIYVKATSVNNPSESQKIRIVVS